MDVCVVSVCCVGFVPLDVSICIHLLRVLHQELFQDPANHQPSLAHLSTFSQHQQVPNTSQTIHTLPTANYPSVHAFTTSDPPYKNTTRYNLVCAPTQHGDVVVDLPLLRVAVSDNPVSLEKPCQASLPPDQ